MIRFIKKRVIREEFILKAVAGKDVLDIGCVGVDYLMELHKQIQQSAKTCIGLDIVAAEGVIRGDAQNFDFDRSFDVIIAGEIIEHLADLKGFLSSVSRNLNFGGQLIITTPNPYSLIALKNAIFGHIVPNNPHHIALFDPTTLRNLFNDYALNLFSGECFYYEEKHPLAILYRINKLVSWLVIGYACGIILDLRYLSKNDISSPM